MIIELSYDDNVIIRARRAVAGAGVHALLVGDGGDAAGGRRQDAPQQLQARCCYIILYYYIILYCIVLYFIVLYHIILLI